MLQYLHSSAKNQQIKPLERLQAGSWVRCERPNEDELAELLSLGLDNDLLSDALDPHEVPRLEIGDDWTYLIARLPDTDDDFNDFTTPILFCLNKDYAVTLSRDSLGRLWQPFIDQARSRTDRPVELLVDMIDAISRQYQRRVATINRQMRAAEYERKLNDYLDALIPMNWAVEKLLATSGLRLRADDKEDVEDLSIDLEQVIARCKSLLRTITNVRDSYRAVMDTRLNETIRLLTVITVALTIPTMIAGLFGMNVPVPGDNDPLMFWKITVVSIVAACALGGFFLRKR